jgi:choline dehydrogenase-like flavoprotein
VSDGRIIAGEEIDQDLDLSCDVCIVGSGAGGGVLAHELAAAGKSVIQLEEGGYHTRRDFDLTEATAFPNLYQEMGNRTTDDLSITILQGRSVGGGTTVNWCTCFRTPKRILDHWHDVHGVEGLTEQALSPHWDWLEKRLHIQEWPEERMNRNNRILWDGCGKLGYSRGLIRRNVNNCGNIGYCGMGCPIDAKQSMLATLIPDAVEKGLTLYANASARTLEMNGRRVAAVNAEVLDPKTDRPNGRKIRVRAKVTAICGGAINSPGLLLRSGLEGHGRVGKRLFLHPTVVTTAVFEELVEAYSGAPQAVHSHHFAERGAGKVGFFLEVPPVHPTLAATTLTGWGKAHEELMAELPYTQATIALSIDGLLDGEEGGTVGLRTQGFGRYKIDYPLTEPLWESFRASIREMARVQFAAGAKRVVSLHAQPVVMESESELAKLDAAPFEKLLLRVVTAHQMGGCAMGKDPTTSVVDSKLRYHELDNLFVVDGSVFPTALGVNPQLSIYGLSRWGAQHVLAALA